MSTPIPFSWDGHAMRPLERFKREAVRQFSVGQTYPLVVEQGRSSESHRHYFAAVEEAWRNLNEETARLFPTSEHLRKYALIKAGYANARSVACNSQVEAHRLATFVKPVDPYAVVTCSRDHVVTIYTAKSQSLKAMDRKTFQESKEKVLEILAGMIGTTPEALQQNAGQAA